MSLADVLLALQNDDRYSGLGHLPQHSAPDVMPIIPPTAPSPAPAANGLLSLLPLLQQAGGGGGHGSRVPAGNVDIGNALMPNSPLLVTRHGETLQRAAMRSLLGEHILPHLTSSYRTPDQQAALYAAKPGLAAKPGTSLHQQGLAIDVDTGWLAAHPEVRQLLLSEGWHQFDSNKEPWHFSYGTTG